jgi:wyosine [tRNA(Phe)-imidazoG37] synthetase (radical SAM superfamily)
MSVTRRVFQRPGDILESVERKLELLGPDDDTVDYLTLVPDGEPTLDINLGLLLEGLRGFGIPTAVISNSSLLWDEGVRDELSLADLVSLKVDSVNRETWVSLDRPHGRLELNRILDGVLEFSRNFSGKLLTETMLVEGMNTGGNQMASLAEFLARVGPETAYLSIPSRPPAESSVRPPDGETMGLALRTLSGTLDRVELLAGYEGDDFTRTGEARGDLLGILAVHPMRESAVLRFLSGEENAGLILADMVGKGLVRRESHQGEIYYARRFPPVEHWNGNRRTE